MEDDAVSNVGEDHQMGEAIATFRAIIPGIQGALRVSGEGATRLMLDTDEQQLPEVLKALAFGKGKCLVVSISVDDDAVDN